MTYTFLTDKIEIRSKDKKYRVKGYATLLGNKVDLKNSIITDAAKQKMLELIKTYDVAVDVRVGSPTFGKYFGVKLSGDNHRQ